MSWPARLAWARAAGLAATVALAAPACDADGAPAPGDGVAADTTPATPASDADATGSDGEAGPGQDAADAGADAPEPEPLSADGGPDLFAQVGQAVTLDASASTGGVSYRWTFGDGTKQDDPVESPVAEHVYGAPGRHKAVVEVFDTWGLKKTDQVVVTVTHPLAHAPNTSASLVRLDGLDPQGRERFAAVVDDADRVVLFAFDVEAATGGADVAGSLETLGAATVPGRPRVVSASPGGGWLAVPSQDAETLTFLPVGDASALGEPTVLALPRGSRPYAAAWTSTGDRVVVTLQGTGQVAEVRAPDPADPSLAVVLALHDALPDVRAVAALPGPLEPTPGAAPPPERFVVSRWRSPDARGEVAEVVLDALASDTPTPAAVTVWPLQFDPQGSSDTETGGVPNYLQALVVSPTGREMALPSTQANIAAGLFLTGGADDLEFDTTVRGVLSWIELPSGAERFVDRKQFDNRGQLSSGTFTSRGDFLFMTARGSRAVERVDALTGGAAGTILDVGYAPDALALTADDAFLLVHATLERAVRVFDVRSFQPIPTPRAEVALLGDEGEPLAPEVLRGKQLFNDAADPRLGKDSYIACAACHLDGEDDGRTWDFTGRGEGMRNTIALLGHAGLGDGPLHWSANFDEVHDFEHDIRGPFGGSGLLDDADWEAGTAATTLGDAKAGLSADLDALAAYSASLATEPPSPHRAAGGALTADASAGKALFESAALGCTGCHSGPRLTDSGWLAEPGPDGTKQPRVHDVGTLTEGSGQRLGGPLTGLDTPTLHGLWRTAPYLHDGSAPTLADVLTTANPLDQHGVTSGLTAAEVDQLVAYLLSLDGHVD